MNRRDFMRLGVVVGLVGAGRGPRPLAALQAAAVPAPAEADDTLWLNWNENALGLAPTARKAIAEAVAVGHRYPDAFRDRLTAKLASRHGVSTDSVILGAGSTQVLQAIVLAAAAPGARLVLAAPTFEAVLRYQRPLGLRVERVPLDDRYAHDLERVLARAGDGPALIYLCNPNNPTATLTPSAEIDEAIDKAPENVLFAVDEAYAEYVRAPGFRSAVDWVEKAPNVVVVRTFSKIYAMAGLRVGYGIAHPETAARLRSYLSLDNVNGLGLAAALEVLEDPELVPRSRAINERAKEITQACLRELELTYLPSHTNFLMHRVPGDLGSYRQRMEERGIRVGRPFPPLTGYNRLSLGLPRQMERFAEVLRDFRQRGWV
jgi:histidinol-phosphate aminotransferase